MEPEAQGEAGREGERPREFPRASWLLNTGLSKPCSESAGFGTYTLRMVSGGCWASGLCPCHALPPHPLEKHLRELSLLCVCLSPTFLFSAGLFPFSFHCFLDSRRFHFLRSRDTSRPVLASVHKKRNTATVGGCSPSPSAGRELCFPELLACRPRLAQLGEAGREGAVVCAVQRKQCGPCGGQGRPGHSHLRLLGPPPGHPQGLSLMHGALVVRGSLPCRSRWQHVWPWGRQPQTPVSSGVLDCPCLCFMQLCCDL